MVFASFLQDRFAALWRSGKLLVEDPNALDVINNKTSFGELLMTYTHRMRKVKGRVCLSACLSICLCVYVCELESVSMSVCA